MDFLSPVVQIILFFWNPIFRQISYLKSLNDNMLTLERETQELKYMHDEVQANVEDAISVGKSRVPRVEDWLKEVRDFVTEVESIRSDFEQRQTCFKGCSIDCFPRYRLGKRVVKKMEYVKELTGKGGFDKLAASPPRSRVLEMQTSLPNQRQSTFEQTLEEIWQCLHDDENAIICVYGIGGIGKTTLMKAINNRFVEANDFSVVIWITVSLDLNLELIQERIGSQLGIKFDNNECISDKSHKLFARLKNIRYMLILDDLWKAFSLNAVGIPKPGKQNRSKIAITTRNNEVCNDMGATRKIKVSTLTDEEAWCLFCEKAGDVALLPGIRPLAEEVVKECNGLPLAIKVVGRAMKEKNKKQLWENALRAFKAPAVCEIRGMESELFLPLKHSYDCLEDPKFQSCFLYCSLFPEDDEISTKKLVRYWAFEEGLIDNIDTLQEAINKGYEIIERLKDSCLLEEGLRSNQHVRMHDLIRDLAIWITCSASSSSTQVTKFLVQAGKGLPHPPDDKMWEGAKRISLMKNRIENLRIMPNCPSLVTLLLGGNYGLHCIHDGFFQFMPHLQILDVSNASIYSLPASLSLLVNLRALICHRCFYLEDIPPLGKLKELQLLDLSYSGIKGLPEGISDLVKLRQLDLNIRCTVATFPCNLISRLTSLEDLILSGYDKERIATLREAATLPRLSTFRICLSSFDRFTADDMYHKFWAGLRRFEVTVGSSILSNTKLHNKPYDKIVRINHHRQRLPLGIEGLTRHAERLRMEECTGVTHLTQLICHSRSLRHISVDTSPGLESIIDLREVGDNALDCLEELHLNRLPDLKKLFNVGEIAAPPTRFQKLKVISIDRCDTLRFVFSSSMVEHLQQLQLLLVAQCNGMEDIIEGDMLPENVLPRLLILGLINLPKLKSICSRRLAFASMKRIAVYSCPELKKLPVLCSGTQKIEGTIQGTREWWEGIEWDDDDSKLIYKSIYSENSILEDFFQSDSDTVINELLGSVFDSDKWTEN